MEALRDLAHRFLPSFLLTPTRRAAWWLRSSLPTRKFKFEDYLIGNQPSPYEFLVDRDNPLEELGERFTPTKRQHNYLPYYWMHFRDIRHSVRNVLEIGVQSGASLRMWEEFFPQAVVNGVDIDPSCLAHEGGRRRVWIGNQGDKSFLRRLAIEAGPFDIVIDDGSHRISHQLTSFEVLYPSLTQNGIYVIEDMGPLVGDTKMRTLRSILELTQSVMYWPPGELPENWPQVASFPDRVSWATKNTIGIAIYRWIVFVMRGDNPGANPYLVRK